MPVIDIPYGRGALPFDTSGYNYLGTVSPPGDRVDGAKDGRELVLGALSAPHGGPALHDLAAGVRRVLIITSDHTRPVPSAITLPLLLGEIRRGSPDAEIVILIATGMHRPTTPEEMRAKFGEEIVDNEVIENHISTDDKRMVYKGILPSGGRLYLNDRVDWADLVIAEGFIEPHFFAGFSGGRKSVLPGIASEQTVRYNHNAAFIANIRARQGVLRGNPINDDMVFAQRAAGLAFILNVLLDGDKRIVAAFAGQPDIAHAAGCDECRRRVGAKGIGADIVITSNGGYPLDQNIYQAVKGISSAETCVSEGGAIIMAAECADGHGGEAFVEMLSGADSPRALLNALDNIPADQTRADQWQAQILARAMCRAEIIFVTGEQNREIIERMGMKYAPDLRSAMSIAIEGRGAEASVAAIPDGVNIIVERT